MTVLKLQNTLVEMICCKCNKKSNSQILQDFALQTTKNESQGSKIQKQSKQILKTALVFVKRLLRKVV